MISLVGTLLLLCIVASDSFRPSLQRGFSSVMLSRRLLANTDAVATPTATNTPIEFLPDGTKYCVCSTCKTAYEIDSNLWKDKKIMKVQCEVCEKEWLQTADRLLTSSSRCSLTPLPAEKIAQVQRILREANVPKQPRVDKAEVFFGNIPYTFDEEALGRLLMEYGVTNVLIVRDERGESKGFGFVEFAFAQDAMRAMSEMNGFYVEPGKKLSVRLAEKSKGKKPANSASQNEAPKPQ